MARPTKTLVPTLVLSTVLLAASPTLADGSWPAYRGPNGSGESPEELPPGDGLLALELAWKRPLGSGYSGISIVDGFLVTAFAEGDYDIVVALDPASGQERWRYQLAPTYHGHDGSHDGPISTPAIADGRVFMLSPWGHLAALDLATGEPLWTTHLVEDHGSEKPHYGYGSSPLVVGDTVVLQIGGDGGSVAGFDVATGDVRWRAVEDEIFSQSPILTEIAGRTQVVVVGTHKIAGIDPTDGTVLWELEPEGEADVMGALTQAPLPIGDDRIFLKYRTGATSVIAVRASDAGLTPTVVSEGRGLARSYSPPTLSGEGLYGYTARFLSAIDPASGKLLWRSRDPGDGFLLSVGGQLAVLTKTGSLHLGAASTEGWHEAARLDLFSDLAWTPPSFADGALYLRSLGEIARVEIVRTETGLLAAAEEPIPEMLQGLAAEVAAAADGTLIVDQFLAGRELPLIDGEQVVFLWRGGEDVAIAGDMIGMRREERMHRLAGTDLWWWQTMLDPHARISYLFYADYEPATDPTHDRRVTTTVLGPDMNWQQGEAVEMSWFAMPEWPGLAIEGRASERHRRLESLELTLQPPASDEGEAPEPAQLPIRVWLPPGYDDSSDRYPVIYVLNPHALEHGAWPEALDRTVGRSVEPLIAVFIGEPRVGGRGADFVNQIVDQVVPQIDERYRTCTDRDSRATVGMGWAGFGATELAFRNPDHFGVLGVQSMYLLEVHMKIIANAIGEADASTVPMRIYLEWGRWDLISPHEEMNMRASSKWAWQLFRDKGWEPAGGEVWDSTDFSSWRHRTGTLLEALFPLEGTQGSFDHWATGRP